MRPKWSHAVRMRFSFCIAGTVFKIRAGPCRTLFWLSLSVLLCLWLTYTRSSTHALFLIPFIVKHVHQMHSYLLRLFLTLILKCLATLAYYQIYDLSLQSARQVQSTATQAGWKWKHSGSTNVEWLGGMRQRQLCYCVNKYLYLYKILRCDFWSISPSSRLRHILCDNVPWISTEVDLAYRSLV